MDPGTDIAGASSTWDVEARERWHHGRVRLADFWERMELALGRSYARSWAEDQHLAELGGRTVQEALAAGTQTREVWRAVCRHAPVPPELR